MKNITKLKYWMFFKLVFITSSHKFFSLCSQLEIYISEGTHSTEEDSECLFLFLLFLLRSSKQRMFPESRTKRGLNVQISSVLTLALWAPLPAVGGSYKFWPCITSSA